MSSTLTEKAVVGRRVGLALYRDKDTYRPGIITAVTGDQAALRIRLDGTRYNIPTRTDHPYLRYLDEVVAPVPALPMGPFVPTADDMIGVWEGVPVAPIGEDGGDLIFLTDDLDENDALDKARAAAAAYDAEVGLDLDAVDYAALHPVWAVFTWGPEDAECPWTVNLAAAEGDEKAVRIHYLPA